VIKAAAIREVKEACPITGEAFPEIPVFLVMESFIEATDAAPQASAVGDTQRCGDISREDLLMTGERRFGCGPKLGSPIIADHVVAEDKHIGTATKPLDAFQIIFVILIVVVEVGDHGANGVPQAFVSGSSRAPVTGELENSDARIPATPVKKPFVGVVGGSIIDGQQLPVWKALSAQRLDRPIEQRAAIEDRHDDRDLRWVLRRATRFARHRDK
jgi:hypothetical protein